MEYEEFKNEVLCGREIEFICRNDSFFIGNGKNGTYISGDSQKEVQYFTSCDELIKKARIYGATLEEIWNEIEVEYVL